MTPAPRQRITIAGVEVDNLTQDEALATIDTLVRGNRGTYLAVVNAAKVAAAARDEQLLEVLRRADVVTADGMSVVWASRLLGRPLKARVTGIDLFDRLVGHAADRGLSVFFLGARHDSVASVVRRFEQQHPGLQVAGYRNGYFSAAESAAVADQIRSTGADLLFVAMGSPGQEFWIAENLVRTGVRFAMGVGGSFDHLSGLARRAPEWMQRAGLEWLYRLLREPRRMWRRYLIGNSLFVWLVAKQRLRPRH
ncbi:MAG TPA: WecB/TagA/CpsF family glycosyltransferase [Blastocatellia bacterium]|nr:WecB/TagA/CpsF family glycosyltransferase [Blastocatellia bacterium]